MRTPLIIPSETQTREFDAKLLLACLATERGLHSYVGSRIDIHLAIDQLPRSIYVAKDFRISSRVIFDILGRLGHRIVAWDEEALLFYKAADYYSSRVDDECLHRVEHLFAWGPANRETLLGYPNFHGCPVEVTGTPRADLTRPELRAFYAAEVQALRDRYGDFILINTNFGKLNHYLPDLRVVPGVQSQGPRGHAPMDAFMTGAWQHRADIFKHFRELVPALARRFPGNQIVVRPHPSESHETWQEAGAGFDNVSVVHEGPVQPWLLATRAMLHNGCSTGLEAFLLRSPVVAYRPVSEALYDLDLSNKLSIETHSLADTCATVEHLLGGGEMPPATPEQEASVDHYVAARRGPLAAERVCDRLDHFERENPLAARSRAETLGGTLKARARATLKRRRARIPGHKNSAGYTAHRFAGISLTEVEERIARYARLLGRFDRVRARRVRDNIFEILPAA